MKPRKGFTNLLSSNVPGLLLALVLVCSLVPAVPTQADELGSAEEGIAQQGQVSDVVASPDALSADEINSAIDVASVLDGEPSSRGTNEKLDGASGQVADEESTALDDVSSSEQQGSDNESSVQEEVTWRAGWVGPDADGLWRYGLSDGTFAANRWMFIHGNWYWFKADGVMSTGWTEVDGLRYWFTDSGSIEGALAGGWVRLTDGWYYLHNVHDGHFGELETGWLNLNDTWYWLDLSTGLAAEDQELAIGESDYAFDASCAMGHDGWCWAGGRWYYASASGALQQGWRFVNGSWYYLDPTTYAMVTGVFSVNGATYVATASGACPANAWVAVDGVWYRTNSSCAACTGWVLVNGTWYYFDTDGRMLTGLVSVGGKSYMLSSSGALVTSSWVRMEGGVAGWASSGGDVTVADAVISDNDVVTFNTARSTKVAVGDASFWVQADGTLLRGWDATHTHYGDPTTGELRSAWFNENGTWYYLTTEGQTASGWFQIGGVWYYFNADGSMREGWLNLNGTWYYLTPGSGAMATGWVNVGGVWYYCNDSGAMQTGWVKVGSTWYYCNGSGAMQTGWLQLGSYWYYLDASGAMATGMRVVNGYTRYFRADGVCTSAGYQNAYPYYAVNGQQVSPRVSYGIFSYVSPIGIGYNATRSQCVEAFIANAYRYVGTPYVWDYSCAPGVGTDCAGLVLQCMYAVGMNPSRYSPYDHFYTYGHDHYANDMRNDAYIRKVPVSQRQRGDLLFWNGHVAIYIGNNQVIEAAYKKVTVGTPYFSISSAIACGRLFN